MSRRAPDSSGSAPSNRPDRGVGSDGRSTRWDHHREQRRAQLVAAAVKAIDRHGREASVDEIARVAGVSKPVLYRYFADKGDLHAAVGQWGATQVIERLTPPLTTEEPIKTRVYAAVEAYFDIIEEHPQVFLLLIQHRVRNDADPLADGKAAVAATLTRVITDAMQAVDLDAGGAEPWAAGVVGLGLSTGEWWLEGQAMSKAAVTRHLAEFVWGAFVGISRTHGVGLPADRS